VSTAVTSEKRDPIWFIDNLVEVKVSGEETEGRCAVLDTRAPKGHMPPLHIHHREDETFILLEGALTVYAGDEIVELAPGDTVLAPKGLAHTFRVDSETARWLVACAPAGFDRFVEAVGSPAAEPVLPREIVMPDPERFEEICRDFSIEIVGPPGALPA
jgi:mannose-6-phosphate isomerase-like protein (cupin superfamily)